jgi:nitrate reductase delta subunit
MRAALHGARIVGRQRLAELDALIDGLLAQSPIDAEADYVQLFDCGRATSLHLFEHVHGDSRDRGPAMIDLAKTYEAAGLYLAEGELPDYLPVVLEYASTQPAGPGARLPGRDGPHPQRHLQRAGKAREPLRQRAGRADGDRGRDGPRRHRSRPTKPLDKAWAEPAWPLTAAPRRARPNRATPAHPPRPQNRPHKEHRHERTAWFSVPGLSLCLPHRVPGGQPDPL